MENNKDFNPLADIHDDNVNAEDEAATKRYFDEYEEALRFVLSDRKGRLVLLEMLRRAKLFDGGFSGDSNAMYFREGARANGIDLFNDIWKVDANAYMTMLKERVTK